MNMEKRIYVIQLFMLPLAEYFDYLE